MSVYHDPDALALLFVQQYLNEQGYQAALSALEEATGMKYDDDKPKRGSELLELVYQYVEKQLMDPEMPDDEPSAYTGTFATDGSTAGRHSRQQQLQQQHAKLQEELMLRSAAADYPSFQTNSLGPLPSNLLSVLTWPGQHAVVAGAADGSVMLLQYGSNGGSNGGSSGGNSGDSRSNEVWVTRLAGAGGVLTLAWHPSIQEGLPSLAAAQQDPNCLLLAGCMDGSVHILHAATGRVLASAKPHSKYVVGADWAPVLVTTSEGQQQQQQQQQEGAGTVRQAGEQLIATASYDSSCCVLRVVPGGSSSSSSSGSSAAQGPEEGAGAQQQLSLEVVQQVPFSGYVQDVCFLPRGAAGPAPGYSSTADASTTNSSSDTSTGPGSHTDAAAAGGAPGRELHVAGCSRLQLAVAMRGTNCLNILDVVLLRYARGGGDSGSGSSGGNVSSSSSAAAPVWGVTAAGLVNMSEAGDSHVSFSAMRLAVSPCKRYILIATDSPILLVLRLSDWGVVRRLYGLDVDKFHNVSVAWHKSSSYIFAGAAHAAVYVYHLGTAKIVARLRGHTVNLRALHYDGSSNRLATCSFDKAVKIYEQP